MAIELVLLIIVFTSAAAYLVLPEVVYAYRKYRGKRLIICPENHRAAAVEVDRATRRQRPPRASLT
jgi:hypothetical protein